MHEAEEAVARTREEERGRGLVRRLIDRFRGDDILGLSAEIAYRFLFAIFPFGLFVAALAAFVAAAVHIESPAQQMVGALGDNLPQPIADTLRPELQRLIASPRADLLSAGALAALWAGTSGTLALVKGIHRAYAIPESRPIVLRYAVAVTLTLVGGFAVIASFVTIIGGAVITQSLADRLGLHDEAIPILQVLRWPAVAVLLVFAVSVLYRYAPNVVVPWRWILLGSALFTGGWVVATGALGLYVTTIGNYGATYGSLAGVIFLLLWFYATAALLLLGAELTAMLARDRAPEQIHVRHEEVRATQALNGATDEAARGLDPRDGRLGKDRLSRS